MVYTIGGLVQFRSEDGAVWVSEDIGVTLTVTTSRLLEYLLLHRGRVIFRDEILQNVWDAHGLKTSGNSLNKYISDLRSAFRNLGFQQELIVTVPKVGFMIAEGVHIEAEEREEKKRAVNLPATAQESEPHRERLRRVSVLLLGGLALLFLATHLDFLACSDRSEERPMGSIDRCQVRSLSPVSECQKRDGINIVADVIKRNRMFCSGEQVYYFSASESVLAGKKGRLYLSRCSFSDAAKKTIMSCLNYYKSDYEYIK